MKLFEMAVQIAKHGMYTDIRPQVLKDLRDAMHPTCPYYNFIHEFVSRLAPLDVIEIGTYVGTSAAHFAWGNTHYVGREGTVQVQGDVVTVDINPDAKRCVTETSIAIGRSNIHAITGDSLSEGVLGFLSNGKFDVLYIDGIHNFSQAYREYFHYREFVREGGLILIDDVGLEMDGDEMNVLWDFIPEPKQRLDHLHTTGFGIVEKTTMTVPHPTLAMIAAMPIIKSRQKAQL